MMKGKIDFYLRNGSLVRDKTVVSLANEYLEKARTNLITMNLLADIQDKEDIRKQLEVPETYSTYEWVVICGYYAMYSAALALLAKTGFRSKVHTATLLVLEEVFVKRRLLDEESFLHLKNAMFHIEEIEKLSDARHKREIAQYSVTKQTTRAIATKIIKDAYDFIDKCEEIISS